MSIATDMVQASDRDPTDVVLPTLARLREIASTGFVIALQVRYMTATYMFECYPQEWLDVYARDGLLMRDPTLRWAMHNAGATRWTALEEVDGAGVFRRARPYGLVHGHTQSILDGDVRSMGGFARPDRDFTDAEIEETGELLQLLHDVSHKRMTFGTQASARLHDMSIALKERSD